jgi:hypothetical protein
MPDIDISVYEPRVLVMARRYGKGIEDIEDLAQEARIAVWKALERKPIDPKPFVWKAIEKAIFQKIQHNNRKKRKPKETILSLDAIVSEEDDRGLKDFIGVEGIVTTGTFVEGVKQELRRQYGRGFIKGLENERYPRLVVRKIFRTIIEDIEGIQISQLPGVIDRDFFYERGLGSFLGVFYGNSPIQAINDAYWESPEIIPWQWSSVPRGYWQGPFRRKRAEDAVKWFINKKGIKNIEDCKGIKQSHFFEEGLCTMLELFYENSPFLALQTFFPNLKPWEMIRVPKGFLDCREKRLEALLSFLISQNVPPISDLSAERTYDYIGLTKVVSEEKIREFGLRGLLARYGSIYNLFREHFPKQILPWTIQNTMEPFREEPRKVAGEAVRWLLKDYLELEDEEVPKYATQARFRRLKFGGILNNPRIGFKGLPYEAVECAFPGMFSRTDFSAQREIVYD